MPLCPKSKTKMLANKKLKNTKARRESKNSKAGPLSEDKDAI